MFSDPVVGEKFFGRSETLELLAKRANGLKDGYRQNIAILGPKLIGKSSLILEFLSTLNPKGIIPIYVDLRRNSLSHFVYKFLGAILYHYLKNEGQQVNEELDSLKERAEKTIPKTVSLIKKIEADFKGGHIDQAYENLLALTAIVKEESGYSSIVILDGFHFLDTFRIKAPFSSFAKEIMTQKDTMYILSSSYISYARKILAHELSLLFGNFAHIYLSPFDYSTCCKFLEKRFAQIALPSYCRDFLIAFSKGHPFYLDIISDKLKEKVKELNQNQITPPLISQALHAIMYDSKGILNQYFTNLLTHNLNGVDYSNYLPILLSASQKGSSISTMSELTNRRPKTITKQINALLDKDLISKFGVFYRIQDKMFRFWLSGVYERKRLSLSSDPVIESKIFCSRIENEITLFSDNTKLNMLERATDLFQAFNNEIVALQNKRYKLWNFEEILPWPKPGIDDCILARYKDGYWACMIKEHGVSDMHVQEFFDSCRKLKQKVRKVVIISCKEWDLNIRLMALEKKMWVWSLEDFNLLLDLYGKQQIVA